MNASATFASSATTTSVWPEPWAFTWSIAASAPLTVSTAIASSPYSWRSDAAGGSPSAFAARGPPKSFTPAARRSAITRCPTAFRGPVATASWSSSVSMALHAAG